MTNLVYRDQHRIDLSLSYFNDNKTLYADVLKQFKDLGIGEIKNRADMMQALNTPAIWVDECISRSITDADLKINNVFRLKKKTVIEMLDLKEKADFLEAVGFVKATQGAWASFGEIGTIKRGKPEVDKTLLDKFIDQNSIYAVTAAEQKALEMLRKVRDSIQALVDNGLNNIENPNTRGRDWLYETEGKKKVTVNRRSFTRLTEMLEK